MGLMNLVGRISILKGGNIEDGKIPSTIFLGKKLKKTSITRPYIVSKTVILRKYFLKLNLLSWHSFPYDTA